MKEIDQIDGTPTKRIYKQVINDYDLEKSICELIDNAIDGWNRDGKRVPLQIDVDFDDQQKVITIKDNAGGIQRSDIELIIRPGDSKTTDSDDTIGIFGVGSKRAAVALAQKICFKTRYQNEKTLRVEYDDEWLEDEKNWGLPLYEDEKPIDAGTTIVELTRLRIPLDIKDFNDLRRKLAFTYGRFLKRDDFSLKVKAVDARPIAPKDYEDWSFPPGYGPRLFNGMVKTDKGNVKFEVLGGLSKSLRTTEQEFGEEYGVYFYCNDRLIQRAVRAQEVGFDKYKAGPPHPTKQIVRIIVSLHGPSNLMPWTSSKTEISFTNPIFKLIQRHIVDALTFYTKTAVELQKSGGWPQTVFQFQTGTIEKITLPETDGELKTYLPNLPKAPSKPKFAENVKSQNEPIAQTKLWTRGLYEAIIAVDEISKLKLTQKNRIQLILLDSTIEIAFKSYLVHEAKMGKGSFDKIANNRTTIHDEIKKFPDILFSDDEWKQIEYFYLQRCDLVHHRIAAGGGLDDPEIANFRTLCYTVLNRLFGLQF